MVGRRWSSRGPSEPISASAVSASLLALQKSARPGEPVSSPVSIRMVELKVKVKRTGGAAEDGRPAMVEPRPVRADQRIGRERFLVGLAEIGEAGRAGFLAGLDQDGGVEAQRSALLQDAGQGGDIDR